MVRGRAPVQQHLLSDEDAVPSAGWRERPDLSPDGLPQRGRLGPCASHATAGPHRRWSIAGPLVRAYCRRTSHWLLARLRCMIAPDPLAERLTLCRVVLESAVKRRHPQRVLAVSGARNLAYRRAAVDFWNGPNRRPASAGESTAP